MVYERILRAHTCSYVNYELFDIRALAVVWLSKYYELQLHFIIFKYNLHGHLQGLSTLTKNKNKMFTLNQQHEKKKYNFKRSSLGTSLGKRSVIFAL